jgi:DNA-binding MarR family transcriptional regulator
MEAAGLARRVPDPADGRSVLVEAARWPAARRDALMRALGESEDTILSVLSRRERATLAALLDKVLDGFE